MDKQANHPFLELPQFDIDKSQQIGLYTGFNSLSLQEIYVVNRQPALRSQIARGWGMPRIVRLPNGGLLASQYRSFLGQAAICESRDDGLTWSAPRLLGLPGRVSQLSVTRNGLLILTVEVASEDPCLYRSTDVGATWSRCEVRLGELSRAAESSLFGFSNGVVELPDGTLLCTFYIDRKEHCGAYVLRSRDAGQTWEDISCCNAENSTELSCVVLPDGLLFGLVRIRELSGEGGASLRIIESSDGGYTWSEMRTFGLGLAQITGSPLLLSDGRLLIIYGNRRFPFGVQAIGSRDFGKTWDLENPIMLAWFSWDSNCGQPSNILMPDESIITAYYARIFKEGHPMQDIVSHVLRWRVPDGWPE